MSKKKIQRDSKRFQNTVKVAKPVLADRDAVDAQLGTNLSNKVIAARKRIDERKR